MGTHNPLVEGSSPSVPTISIGNQSVMTLRAGDSNLGPRDYEYPYLIESGSESRRNLNGFPVLLLADGSGRTYPERSAETRGRVSVKRRSGSSSWPSEPTEPSRTNEVGRDGVGEGSLSPAQNRRCRIIAGVGKAS